MRFRCYIQSVEPGPKHYCRSLSKVHTLSHDHCHDNMGSRQTSKPAYPSAIYITHPFQTGTPTMNSLNSHVVDLLSMRQRMFESERSDSTSTSLQMLRQPRSAPLNAFRSRSTPTVCLARHTSCLWRMAEKSWPRCLIQMPVFLTLLRPVRLPR